MKPIDTSAATAGGPHHGAAPEAIGGRWSDDRLEDIMAQQRAITTAYCATDEARALWAALDERDAVEGMKRRQEAANGKAASSLSEREKREEVRALEAELSEINRRIARPQQPHQPAADGAIEPAKVRAVESRPVPLSILERPAPSVSTIIVHKLGRRRTHLDPAIDRAIQLTADRADHHAVWNAFVALAQESPPMPPLTGYRPGRVSHLEGEIDKQAFIKRLKRRAREEPLSTAKHREGPRV